MALDEHQGAALVDAVRAYMGLMSAVGTEMRLLSGLTEDAEQVEAFRVELDAALERFEERSRARQEAAAAAAAGVAEDA